jgi:hypothetical protein
MHIIRGTKVKNVVFAASMVIMGLILGLLIWTIEALLSWLFSLIFNPNFTLLGFSLAKIGAFLFGISLILLLIFMIWSISKERSWSEAQIETLREVGKAIRNMRKLQKVSISEDGKHAFIALHIEDKDWNEKNPFFTASVMSTTPGLLENGRYYYILVKYVEGYASGQLIPISMSMSNDNEIEIITYMKTKGIDYLNNAIWRSFHKLFSESSIPYFTPISTSICVFFIALSSKKINSLFTSYIQNKFFPCILQKNRMTNAVMLEEPPKGLEFDSVISQFRTEGNIIRFKENIKNVPLNQIDDKILEINNLFCTFSPKYKAQVIFPMKD